MKRTFQEKRLFVAMKRYDEIREYLDSTHSMSLDVNEKLSELTYYEDIIAKIMIK